VLFDVATPEGRRELGFSDEDSAKLAGATIVSFRVHDGDDASCLNLYQPTQPRILGTPPEFFDHANFAWTSLAIPSDSQAGNPKVASLLERDLGTDEAGQPIVPITLDRNTATYSMKVGAGDQMKFRDGAGRDVTVQVAFALLLNSVLQGDVLMSEANFLKLYPDEAGRRFFLIRRGPDSPSSEELATLLETQLEDFGFDAVDARARLAELLAVQNTYLSTFQSLGGLGLLLGVIGLAVVQLRSVLERRGELALMQAAGFRRRRLAWMVLLENLVLLIGGLGIGSLAALAVVLPHALSNQANTPWATLVVLLAIIALAGAAAAWAASRVVLRTPLLPALRGD
jgi:putative ABC transport system permease protein